MNELDKFYPPPRLTATPRQVERVTQPFCESANAASADLFQHMTSQLLVLFRAQGCALPVAEELAQNVTGELTARVREVLRRPALGASWISGVIQVGDLKLDLERRMLWRGDDEIHLSPKEFDLLAFMMKNVDVLLTHVKLLRSVWGLEYGGELEYLRTYVCALRKKIEKNPGNPEYIVSEPWIGYRFRNPPGVARRLVWREPCVERLFVAGTLSDHSTTVTAGSQSQMSCRDAYSLSNTGDSLIDQKEVIVKTQ